MSVIIRGDHHDKNKTCIKLYCKGSDTMIMERLSSKNTSQLLRSATIQHLDKFASDGLRTLCLAYKEIDNDYLTKWLVCLFFNFMSKKILLFIFSILYRSIP